MTTTPRGLVVDDRPAVTQRIMDILDFGFRKLDWSVEWRSAHTALDALRLVQAEAFDFAVIDYELEQGETGLSVVEELRRLRRRDCYILVATAESNNNPNFVELSKSAGADHAIIRNNQLTLGAAGRTGPDGWDGYSLARRIRRRLRVLDRADGFKIVFSEEAGVQSMLHSLGDPPGEHHDAMARGEEIARTLIIECLEREDDAGTRLTVRHLAAGRSGAHVCKVVREEPNHGVESFVLKIGLDRAALEAEKAANAKAAQVLVPQVLVRLSRDLKTDETSGYTAIVADLAHDALTLGSWLRLPATTAEQARAVADELHGGHLVRLLQPSLRQARLTSRWLEMSPVLRVRVHDAVDAYAGIWTDVRGAGRADAPEMAAALRGFVDSGALPGTDERRLGERVVHAHGFGDLHSDNVLVQNVGRPRPLLVDASQYGVHHWATDVTRLLVDLVLRVRRPGVESMLWSGVAADAAFADGLCHCAGPADTADGQPAEPVDAFIAQVVAGRRRYLCLDEVEPREANWHWQWHVALAREFLRQGARPGLPPTRAVVALTAAAGHLDRAAEALRD